MKYLTALLITLHFVKDRTTGKMNLCIGALVVFLGILSSHVYVDGNPSPRIIGGSVADIEDFPWQVSVMEGNKFICGGVIWDANTVITSAQCVASYASEGMKKLTVHGGISNVAEWTTAQFRRVKEGKVHPQYKEMPINRDISAYNNDIAILHLSRPLNFNDRVNKIDKVATRWNEKKFLDNPNCWVTGYGEVKDKPSYTPAKNLRKLNINLVSTRECKNFYMMLYGRDDITSKMLCNLDTHGTDCFHDIGGPVGCIDPKTGEYTLVGIVSFGPRKRCLAPPSVYSRMSRLRAWVMRETS